MTHRFDEAALTGVLTHMNTDHPDDNVLIARAFGAESDITGATMIGFDGEGGQWSATRADESTVEVHAPWPGGPITERSEVRRQMVALYEESCRRLGIEPRSH